MAIGAISHGHDTTELRFLRNQTETGDRMHAPHVCCDAVNAEKREERTSSAYSSSSLALSPPVHPRPTRWRLQ
eukprot:11990805-Alexandrium_andersonii.AAC.1